jgi:hypothetical protein
MRLGAYVLLALSPLAVGCAYPLARGSAETSAPVRSANRTPKSLCARELATLGDDDGGIVRRSPPPDTSKKDAAHLPKRRVMLENRLPGSYAILALTVPSNNALIRREAPEAGQIGEVDGRGARGEVSVLVQAKRSGGLYDYVGDCEVVREYIELPPWNQRPPAQGKVEDLIVVVELADGRPMVHVTGVPPARGVMLERYED